jgi:hypothetical protein
MSGTLYVVATPLGNLEDITLRALRVLKEVHCIAAEDTRHSRKLLTHYGIGTKLTSYHDHIEQAKAPRLVERLKAGEDIALISDAGTPGIADPGYRLVRAAIDAGVRVADPGSIGCHRRSQRRWRAHGPLCVRRIRARQSRRAARFSHACAMSRAPSSASKPGAVLPRRCANVAPTSWARGLVIARG